MKTIIRYASDRLASLAIRRNWEWLWFRTGAIELWCDEHSDRYVNLLAIGYALIGLAVYACGTYAASLLQ